MMQVTGISNPIVPLGSGSAKYTAIVDRYARTLNDANASLDDQLAAYQGLGDLSSASSSGAAPLWLTNKEDLAKADDAMSNSAFAKRMKEVGARFIGRVMDIARRDDWAQCEADIIGSLSEDDQKILVKAFFNFDGRDSDGSGIYKFDTGAEWQAHYQKIADANKAKQAAASTLAVEVTLSDRALAILANGNASGKASTPAEQAQQLLGVRGAPVSNAEVALQLLQKSAESKDATKSSGSEKAVASVGNLADRVARHAVDGADVSQQAQPSATARAGRNA